VCFQWRRRHISSTIYVNIYSHAYIASSSKAYCQRHTISLPCTSSHPTWRVPIALFVFYIIRSYVSFVLIISDCKGDAYIVSIVWFFAGSSTSASYSTCYTNWMSLSPYAGLLCICVLTTAVISMFVQVIVILYSYMLVARSIAVSSLFILSSSIPHDLPCHVTRFFAALKACLLTRGVSTNNLLAYAVDIVLVRPWSHSLCVHRLLYF